MKRRKDIHTISEDHRTIQQKHVYVQLEDENGRTVFNERTENREEEEEESL